VSKGIRPAVSPEKGGKKIRKKKGEMSRTEGGGRGGVVTSLGSSSSQGCEESLVLGELRGGTCGLVLGPERAIAKGGSQGECELAEGGH